MVEIIRKGTKKDIDFHETCKNCGCHFKFKRHEAIYNGVGSFRGEDFYEIKCPQCSQRAIINKFKKYVKPTADNK